MLFRPETIEKIAPPRLPSPLYLNPDQEMHCTDLHYNNHDTYGVPLGPHAILSLAFLFKSFHMKTSNVFQTVKLTGLKEIARVRGRGSKISPSLSHSRFLAPRTLAFSSLASFKTSKELGPRTAKLALFHVKIVNHEIV